MKGEFKLLSYREKTLDRPINIVFRLNKSGNHEGAARHAFFSGHLERAMSYLKICESEFPIFLLFIPISFMCTLQVSN